MRESTERAFQAYYRPIVMIALLKYLWQVLTAAYDDWTVVVGNLCKARNSWAWMARILGQKGNRPRVSRIFCGAGGTSILVRDLGNEPPHGKVSGKFP